MRWHLKSLVKILVLLALILIVSIMIPESSARHPRSHVRHRQVSSVGLFEGETPYRSDLEYLWQENPDIKEALPDQYLDGYKSFCWYNKANTTELLCLPSVHLVGFIKCGSSDFHQKMSYHSDLFSGRTKERRWWSRYRLPHAWRELPPLTPGQSFSHYLHEFQPENVKKDTVLWDASVGMMWQYLYWEQFYPHLEERPYSYADVIHTITPRAKVLAIVRNPTERLWSAYLFYHGHGIGRMYPLELGYTSLSPKSFDIAVRNEMVRFRDCVKEKGLRKCCFDTKHMDRYDKAVIQLSLGIYVCYITEWKEKFGNQLKVIRLEDYKEDRTGTVKSTYEFLGLPPVSTRGLKNYIKSLEIRMERPKKEKKQGDMLESTRQLLDSFYKPYNEELARLMGDDRFLYN